MISGINGELINNLGTEINSSENREEVRGEQAKPGGIGDIELIFKHVIGHFLGERHLFLRDALGCGLRFALLPRRRWKSQYIQKLDFSCWGAGNSPCLTVMI